MKDTIPGGLRLQVVYKFTCAGCNVCYIGETSRHFSRRVREHLSRDKASHIFKHLQNSLCSNSLVSEVTPFIIRKTIWSFHMLHVELAKRRHCSFYLGAFSVRLKLCLPKFDPRPQKSLPNQIQVKPNHYSRES